MTAGDININVVDNYGNTLLHTAVIRGTPQIVELLLKNGAHVNTQEDMLEYTPLHFAAVLRSTFPKENIEFLLQHGADIEAKDIFGQTPLYCAVEQVKRMRRGAEPALCVDLAIQLLGHGANPDADAFIEASSADKLTARAYVHKHWHEFYVRMFNKAEEAYKASNRNAQTSAQLLGRSLSQVTNPSLSSSSSVPQTEHRQAPSPHQSCSLA